MFHTSPSLLAAPLFQSAFDVTASTSTSDLGSAIKSAETISGRNAPSDSELLTPAEAEAEAEGRLNSSTETAAAATDDFEMSEEERGFEESGAEQGMEGYDVFHSLQPTTVNYCNLQLVIRLHTIRSKGWQVVIPP